MTQKPTLQAIDELKDLVKCNCHEGFTSRGLHDPYCQCYSAEAVQTLADAIDANAALIAELVEALESALDGAHWGYKGTNFEGEYSSEIAALAKAKETP